MGDFRMRIEMSAIRCRVRLVRINLARGFSAVPGVPKHDALPVCRHRRDFARRCGDVAEAQVCGGVLRHQLIVHANTGDRAVGLREQEAERREPREYAGGANARDRAERRLELKRAGIDQRAETIFTDDDELVANIEERKNRPARAEQLRRGIARPSHQALFDGEEQLLFAVKENEVLRRAA